MRETIFQEAWWLDIAAPGWRELTVEAGGRTVARLRYRPTTQGPFRLCGPPPMSRVAAPVVLDVAGHKPESRQRRALALIGELLDRLPPFDLVRFALDAAETDILPYLGRDFRPLVQHTFLIDCAKAPEAIWAGLRDKTRNVVRRARERLEVTELADAERFVAFYRQNLGDARSYVALDLVPALFAAAFARDRGRILAATDAQGRPHAMVMILWDARACYYYLSTRDAKVADLGAVGLLVWRAMAEAQRRGLVFDLDGVTSASRLQFLLGFGGAVASRFVVERGSLAWDAYAGLRDFGRRVLGRRHPAFTS